MTTTAVLIAAPSHAVAAREASPLSAAASDPVVMGWMRGHPPPPDRIVRASDPDAFAFPKLRWTACHVRELLPTVAIGRGAAATSAPLERALDGGIDAVEFTPLGGGRPLTWRESLDVNYTDGVVVLHRGRIVHERYFGCLDEAGVHAAMSVTKSLVGLLGEALVAEGTLDEAAAVSSVVPELAGSAFGDATIRQVLEMTTGLHYSEDYADPAADVWRYAKASNPLDGQAGEAKGVLEFLRTVRSEGSHGGVFAYKTVNAEVLGWIVARAMRKSVAQLASERIWSEMGAEQDGYLNVDAVGTPIAGGGLSAGLRDLARLGQLVLEDGRSGGRQLLPTAAIARIRRGGDREAFARSGHPQLNGWSYRGMWWVTHNEHGAFTARGIHGQALYVDPAAEMVIARFGSHPIADNAANDPTSLPAYHAVAKHLLGRG